MTRLLLILVAASFALTVLALISDDTVAERRAVLPAAPQHSATAPPVPRHVAPALTGVTGPAVST